MTESPPTPPVGPDVLASQGPSTTAATCPWCSAVLPHGQLTRCPICGDALNPPAASALAALTYPLAPTDPVADEGVAPGLAGADAASLIVLSPTEELEAVMPPSPELRREMERLASEAGSDVSDAVPAAGADPEGARIDPDVLLVRNDAAELEAVMPPSPELRREMERLASGEDEPPASPGT